MALKEHWQSSVTAQHYQLRVTQAEMYNMVRAMDEKRRFLVWPEHSETTNADAIVEAGLRTLDGMVSWPKTHGLERIVYDVVVVSPAFILNEIARIRKVPAPVNQTTAQRAAAPTDKGSSK